MSKSGSNKFMIIAVILAILILGAAIYLAKSGGGPINTDQLQDNAVVVSLQYQICAPGDQCIVVDKHCGFCCDYIAINARYEGDFNTLFDDSCSVFRGESCSCFDLSSYPSCVDNVCQLVEWPNE